MSSSSCLLSVSELSTHSWKETFTSSRQTFVSAPSDAQLIGRHLHAVVGVLIRLLSAGRPRADDSWRDVCSWRSSVFTAAEDDVTDVLLRRQNTPHKYYLLTKHKTHFNQPNDLQHSHRQEQPSSWKHFTSSLQQNNTHHVHIICVSIRRQQVNVQSAEHY